jgi:hypothetical protein
MRAALQTTTVNGENQRLRDIGARDGDPVVFLYLE